MDFALTILGVSGALPAHGRFPSAQVLEANNQLFLIDCGEGAQIKLGQYEIARNKIEHIFISHLHGDHVFGLPGLLFSFALNNRTKPVHLYAPSGLDKMILPQIHPAGSLPFPIYFHNLIIDTASTIFQDNNLTVQSIPLDHRIPSCGFLFKEKKPPLNIKPEKIHEFNLNIKEIKSIKEGNNLLIGNTLIPNNTLTLPPYRPRSYAYISDTAFLPSISKFVEGADLLYHESTFCENHSDKAKLTKHTTARQAAQMAQLANVKKLILGHFSSRYTDLSCFELEAKEVFANTVLGEEGRKYVVERQRII